MKNLLRTTLYLFLASGMVFSTALAQDVPSGRAIDLPDVLGLAQSVGGFLYWLGSILGAITIIASGIMYFLAGANQQKVAAAKSVLKAGLIGSLVVLGSGLIFNTLKIFASDPLKFFE